MKKRMRRHVIAGGGGGGGGGGEEAWPGWLLAQVEPLLGLPDLHRLRRCGRHLCTELEELWMLGQMRRSICGCRITVRSARYILDAFRRMGLLPVYYYLWHCGPSVDQAYAYSQMHLSSPHQYFERTRTPYELRNKPDWLLGEAVLQHLHRLLSNLRCFLAHQLIKDDPSYAYTIYGLPGTPVLPGVLGVLYDSMPLHRWPNRDLLLALLQQGRVAPPPLLGHTIQLHLRHLARLRVRQAWRQWRRRLG